MSEKDPPARPVSPPARGPFGGGMNAGPPQKSKNFKASARRLIGTLAPERGPVIAVIAASIASIALAVSGPRILGEATNLIFAGVIGMHLPSGATKAEAIANLHAQGNDRLADLMRGMDVVPGQGVDFHALAAILALVMALYAGASLFAWLQGYLLNRVVQRSVKRLRSDVQDKMSQLPLAYFDTHPHGELLSRVTNDIDNVATGLQQSLGQILNSLLTAVGVLVRGPY